MLLVRQRHWVTFIEAGRWFVLALVAGLGSLAVNGSIPDDGIAGPLSTLLRWAFWAFLAVGIAGLGWYYLTWRIERYLVTTRRVIEAGGVINKYTRDTSLGMITDMLVNHPWLGRILGYGEIDLLTASDAGTSKIRFLPHADDFKKALLDAKHEHDLEVGGARAFQDAVAVSAVTVDSSNRSDALTPDELDSSLSRLADLRDRGLISAEEFDEKKKELLDRL